MNILIIDDEPGLRSGIRKVLSIHGYQSFEADSEHSALEMIKKHDIHIALLDLRLGKEDGRHILLSLKQLEPLLSIIIITGYGDIKSAVECMKSGAMNYLTKPIDHELLLSILDKESEALQLRKNNYAFKETLKSFSPISAGSSIHQEMQEIEQIINKVKDSPVTVLISGETGTGKEVAAKRIHYSGCYAEQPFIGVNCGSLHDNLLESELFGHEKGAFTGAVERKIGRFELAGKGTLFLDEIGDMSPTMQTKLLRVLQEQTYERVGGTKSIRSQCRIIAATNRDIEHMKASDEFRADLYYRMSVIRIHLPPLRCRPGDIPSLVKQFISEANSTYHRSISGVTPRLLDHLNSYHWPGNIRELKNVISKLVILTDQDILDVHDEQLLSLLNPVSEFSLSGDLKTVIKKHTGNLERDLIRRTLNSCSGNISRAARELGVSRKTLYEKMRTYHL